MTDSVLLYTLLIGYFVVSIALGWMMRKYASGSAEDYFLAGRKVGPVVLFFTFVATNFSAFFFLGFAGEGYRYGYSFYAMMAFGTAFAAISFYLIGYQTWKLGKLHGYITPVEMVAGESGSKTLKYVFLAVMVIFTLPYLAIQPVGAGYILEEITNGAISYKLGASLLTLFIVIYVFIGGMRSVAVTDMLQGILMFTLMILAVYFVSSHYGGLNKANQQVFTEHPELFSRAGGGGHFTPKIWFSSMILWVVCVPMFPQMFIRFFISKDVRSFKISTVLYAAVPALLFLCPVMIGVLGHLEYPELTDPAQINKILPTMLDATAPPFFAALIMVGAIAAFMSTLDSQLLALSTLLTRDFYKSLFKPNLEVKGEIKIGQWLIVALAVGGLIIAMYPPDSIYELVKIAFTGYAGLFPATVAVLYFRKRIPNWACIASVVLAEGWLLGHFFGWLPEGANFGFEVIVPILVIAFAVLLVGALIGKKKLVRA